MLPPKALLLGSVVAPEEIAVLQNREQQLAGFSKMQKVITAAVAAVVTLQFATPVLAHDMFNRNTMLGWRHQTGPAVVAYFRTPIGPSTFKTRAQTGFAVTGPRAYRAGSAPLYSAGPQLLDFTFAKHDVDARWIAQLNVGKAVAWTNDPKSVKAGQVNLMESGMSWVIVGAVAAGLAAATLSIIEAEPDAP
jgi:hypothetical protein